MDFYNKLASMIEDEYNDVLTYVELSKSANDAGESQVLRDIAREEYIHAEHLEAITGKSVESEIKAEAKKALETV